MIKPLVLAIALTLTGSAAAHAQALRAEAAATECAGKPSLNTATAAELECLDGIGPVLAARIVQARADLGGRFARIEDLMRVRGIGRKTFARIAPHVTL